MPPIHKIVTFSIIFFTSSFLSIMYREELDSFFSQKSPFKNQNSKIDDRATYYQLIKANTDLIDISPVRYMKSGLHSRENPVGEWNQKAYDPKYLWHINLQKRIENERPTFLCIMKLTQTCNICSTSRLIDYIELSILVYSVDHLNIIIRDAENVRWEYPFRDPHPHVKHPIYMDILDSEFDFTFKESPFRLVIFRKETKEAIFELSLPFIYSEYYTEFAFTTPTNEIYGLGERLYTLQFKPGTYTLFIFDRSGEIERGRPGFNQQGHHSMYLMKEQSGKYHVNMYRNINPQEITISESRKHKWITTGGVIDFNIFLGNNPEDAILKYHKYIGGWSVPPFWAMGHHQSKWGGYYQYTYLEYIIRNYDNEKIPLDTIWSDIDYFEDSINLRVDKKAFPFNKMKEMLDTYKKKLVAIVDPFIPMNEKKKSPMWYIPNAKEVILATSTTEKNYNASWFSGPVFVIDFLNPKADEFWKDTLQLLEDQAPFYGIWDDANEITAAKAYLFG